MKRWISAAFAIGSFFGTLGVSAFAFFQLRTVTSSAAATPVNQSSNQQVVTAASPAGSFVDAQAFFTDRKLTLSLTPSKSITGVTYSLYTDTTDKNVTQAADELQSEWKKYSQNTLNKSGLRTIYLVRNLRIDGQARSAYPEPVFEDALYFDIGDVYLQSENTQYMRRTFHHEYNHLLVFNLFGAYEPADAAWLRCNAADFSYGTGGPSMYDDVNFAHKEHPTYGFVDGYATSGVAEDKAEVFARFMTDPAGLQKLADKDAGISCKLSQTVTLLQNL